MDHNPLFTTTKRSDVPHGLGNPRRVRILRYQRIAGDSDPGQDQTHIPAKAFRQQLESIERWGYSFITFDDYRLFLKGHINLPGKPVVLLFDQPYRDNFRYMFPILQKLGIRAVVIATGTPGGKVGSEVGSAFAGEFDYMEGKDLLEMHAAGFEIGTCGMSYKNLVDIPRADALKSITEARMKLEILLNAPVLTFSYPLGIATADIRQMVMNAGYTLACAGGGRSRGLAGDPFDVKSINVTQAAGTTGLHLRLLLG
jgi:peptidoglycan/xylan/chitin deacetylase (PgdA/CDA1 family)